MKIKQILFLQLLMAVILAAGLSGCSSKVTFGLNIGRVAETREEIDRVIAEPERRAKMQAIVDAYVAEAERITEEVKAIRQEIVAKNRDYDTTRAEL